MTNFASNALNSVKSAGSRAVNRVSDAATAGTEALAAAGNAAVQTAADLSTATGMTRLAAAAAHSGWADKLMPLSAVIAFGIPGIGPLASLLFKKGLEAGKAANDQFIRDHGAAFSTRGQTVLTELSMGGRLGAVDRTGRSLRDTLATQLAAGTPAATLEPVLAQVNDPKTITQVRPDTCAAASVQHAIALANPGLYTQIAADLLAGGKAQMPSGITVEVSAANKQWIEQQTAFTPEQRVSAYFQAALMDYANGQADYAIASDTNVQTAAQRRAPGKHPGGAVGQLLRGLSIGEAHALEDVAGEALVLNPSMINGADAQARSTGLVAALADAKRESQPGVLLPIKGHGKQLHMVTISVIDAAGKVTFADPATGRTRSADRDTFDQLVAWTLGKDDGIGTGTATAATAPPPPPPPRR